MGSSITDALIGARFLDRGGAYINIEHPDFGAVGGGVIDDGPAIAAAMATADRNIFFPGKKYGIGSTLLLRDHQYLIGAGPSNSETELVALPSLGTDPMFKRTGNLTRGGLYRMQLTGTNDVNGGDGIDLDASLMADFWSLDEVFIRRFTKSAVTLRVAGGQVAGVPLFFGYLKISENGIDGISPAFDIDLPVDAVVRIRFLSGDNNGAELLRLESMNTTSALFIDSLQSERTIDGKQDNIITVDTANGGLLSIGQFWVFSNVIGGSNGNAFVREINGSTLRLRVEHCYSLDRGAQTYTFGFDSSGSQITRANFIRKAIHVRHPVLAAAGISMATDGAEPNIRGAFLCGEISNPAAPATNQAIIYCRDTGGKTELVVRFSTGAIQQIAIEP